MNLPWSLFRGRPAAVVLAPDVARSRREALVDAALALANAGGDLGLEHVLQVAAGAAARITGAGAALAIADADGRLERFAAQGVDGCTRDTLARPEVMQSLVGRLRALGRPVGPDDLEGATARPLAAVAPYGLLVVPVDADALLVLVKRIPEEDIDEDAVAVVTILARLTGATLARLRDFTELKASCDELRRLCDDVLARQDDQLSRTARALHEGVCQRLAAANAQLEALGQLIDRQPPALARLRDARGLVNQTVGELRELAQLLRPSVLENLGYVEALRWYLGRLHERSGIAPSLVVEGAETRLPVEVESALYRATEAALGAAVDARGPLVVHYRGGPGGVRLEIVGPPPDTVDLVAIRERLRPFGGAVQVTALADRAPMIAVEVPTRLN